jgi:hypothetical protein
MRALTTLKDGVPLLSGPVTGTELFVAVKHLLVADERCFNATEWVSGPGHSLAGEQQPACGWVACIAGWITLLTRGELAPDVIDAEVNNSIRSGGHLALGVLKMHWNDIEDLFAATSLNQAADVPVALARIDEFVDAHRAYLDALVVQPDATAQQLRG